MLTRVSVSHPLACARPIHILRACYGPESISSRHQMYRKIEAAEIPPEVDHAGRFKAIIKTNAKDRISAAELLKILE